MQKRKVVEVLWIMLALVLGLLFSFNNCSWAEEKGLAGWWKFDEGKGNIAKNTSGSHNDGEIHGAKWKENKSGYCLEFDGVNDYVDCGNDASLNITDEITLEAWVKLIGSGTKSTIITKGYCGSSKDTPWQLFRHQNNDVRFSIGDGTNYYSSFSGVSNF